MGDLFKSKSKTTTDQTTTQQQQSTQEQATSQTQSGSQVQQGTQAQIGSQLQAGTQSQTGTNTTSGSNVATVNTGPSQFQLPALSEAFGAALANYNASKGSPFYTGDLYAGMTDQQRADNASAREYALTTGMGTAKQLSEIGSSLGGYSGKIDGAIQEYLALANGDATADITAAARTYAYNPFVGEQIDAVNRDVIRQLNEDTLPGIDRQASYTGNINSSRAGVAAGIAQRGAADRAADNAASIRSKAYETGLSMAQQERQARLSALSSVIGTYSGLTGQGVSALGAGSSAGFNALSALSGINAAEQADRQGKATADFTKWQGNDTRSSDLLDRFYKTIGGNSWGNSGTTSTVSNGTENSSTNGSSTSATDSRSITDTMQLLNSLAEMFGTANSSGSSSGTGTQQGTTTASGGPGLLGAAMGGLAMAGGLGWQPFAVKQKG